MSIAAVAHRYVFGLKGDVSNNIAFIDETNLVYPAGANTVIYNTESKSQKFIPASDNCAAITAMDISLSKRYAAVAERGGDKPVVCVYDLNSMRKRKTLIPQDIECKEFVYVKFSADGKYILAQSGSPDWTLFYWSWERTKLMAYSRTTSLSPIAVNPSILSSNSTTSSTFGMVATQVSFNPSDNTQICVTGNGIFKLFRYQEGALKQLTIPKYEMRNFLCHCWLHDDKIALASDDGKVGVFEANGELRCEITNNNSVTGTPLAVYSILPNAKGFYAGGEGGSVNLYEKTEDSNSSQLQAKTEIYFRKIRDFTLSDETCKVTNMACPQSEEILVVTTEKNQIFSLVLTNADVKPEDVKFEVFSQPFHHGQITGMDTCIRKPLIVTCSSDKSIRVWNYLEATSELVKYFPEEAFSVALHPSGLYILVGFSDKLRLMNVLIDDIRPFREFTVRGCRECRFSNGGQYFAAVHGNTIQIYSTWNFENLGNLKGHNGKVRSLFWSSDDSKIVSSGMDGAIYDWGLKDLAIASSGASGGNAIVNSGFKREGENILKTCAYSCAVASPDGKSIYAVGSDKNLKEIVDSQIVREIDSDVVLTQVVLSHSGKMMFLGSTSGKIRSMRFPIVSNLSSKMVHQTIQNTEGGEKNSEITSSSAADGDYQEHQGHSSVITKLRVSYDDQYLFSTSEDGCLYVFKINDKDTRGVKSTKEIIYADEILVTKSDLEEKNTFMAELKTRVEELKMENEYQIRLKDMNFNEKIKEVTEKFQQEIEALKITSNVLRTDKEKEGVRHEEEMGEEKDRHSKELMELESIHNSKLMTEYDKYQEIQTKTQELRKQWELQMSNMQISKEKVLAELVTHFETKLREKQMEIDSLKEEMRGQFVEIEETTRETEEDADAEISGLKHKYERRLKDEKEIGLRLKGENGVMRKRFNTLQSEIDAQKTEINKMYAEEKKLHAVIKSLEKDITGLKKEIQERDETIQDKEKRIYDLKKKNQELEKFKFVLDYKIKELKRQIEPREMDIQGMTGQIKEMDVELDQYYKSNSKLELAITDIKLQLKAAEREVAKEREKWKALSSKVMKFKVDLVDCLSFVQDPKLLKKSLEKLYQKFSREGDKKEESGEKEVQQEYTRQREYLERTVGSLRIKASKDEGLHRTDNTRIMQENVTLIKEINSLRRDLKGVHVKEKTVETNLKYVASLPTIGNQL